MVLSSIVPCAIFEQVVLFRVYLMITVRISSVQPVLILSIKQMVIVHYLIVVSLLQNKKIVEILHRDYVVCQIIDLDII